jgi:hypothetical protein
MSTFNHGVLMYDTHTPCETIFKKTLLNMIFNPFYLIYDSTMAF